MVLVYSKILNELRATAKCFTRYANQLSLVRAIWLPRTTRGRLVRLIVGIWLSLTLTIFLTLAVSRTGKPILLRTIPDYLLPGRPLPEATSRISGDGGFRYIAYCTVFQEGLGIVYLTYDQRIRVIRSTGLVTNANTIGDSILEWGNPDSFRYANGMFQIFWGNKSVSVWTPLNPDSPIRAIHYELESSDLPQDRLAWRGFVTFPSEAANHRSAKLDY